MFLSRGFSKIVEKIFWINLVAVPFLFYPLRNWYLCQCGKSVSPLDIIIIPHWGGFVNRLMKIFLRQFSQIAGVFFMQNAGAAPGRTIPKNWKTPLFMCGVRIIQFYISCRCIQG